MYFPSKRDLWLSLVVWIPLLGVMIPIILIPFKNGQFDPISISIFVPVMAFIAWIWFGTGYRVTEDKLKILSGPIRLTIPLEKITSIESTRNPISSPALSLDRLEINYGEGKFAIISPQDKEGFINLIVGKYPKVNINGNIKKLDDPRKTKTKVMIGVAVVLTALTLAGVGTLLYFGNKPAEYSIQDGTLRISGEYGEEIMISDIVGITMKEQIPEIQLRTNGSALGSKKKGYFNLTDIGQAKLFVDTQKPPYIFINVKSGLRIVNTEEPMETAKLYNKLLVAWKQNSVSK